jgi:DNA polymerase III epsilon subunit family exonuclease
MGIWILLALAACIGTLWYQTKNKAGEAGVPPVPERFVVFDLETTGLDASVHEIIEIGAIRVNRDSSTHDTLQALIRPRKKISPKITELTGITNEMVEKEGEPLEAVLAQFREFFGDLPLVAFNAEFDVGFLNNAIAQVTPENPLRNKVTCALKMARKAWPDRKRYRLADLAKDGNLDLRNAHRALGDCQRTMIVYGAAARVLGSEMH